MARVVTYRDSNGAPLHEAVALLVGYHEECLLERSYDRMLQDDWAVREAALEMRRAIRRAQRVP